MAQILAPPTATPEASFAALGLTRPVTRVGGGYETDVYFSGELGLALKLKHQSGDPAAMLTQARRLSRVAERFRAHLGPEHSLPTTYLVVAGEGGKSQVLAVQPFLEGAHPLDSLDHAALGPAARAALAAQLATIVERAMACFRQTGTLPDLYGLGSHEAAEARRWDPRWLLRASWRLVAGRPLIGAHNLLLTSDGRVVLVDYDPICGGRLSCRIVYVARALLLWRDQRHIAALARP